MSNLRGKVAIVTGSSRGIGRATAERLGRDGASVVVNYAKNADRAREVVHAIEASGGKAVAVQADISRVADIRRLFDEAESHFGRLDILVNNAGVVAFSPVAQASEELFESTFATNARSVFFALQEAAKRIADGGRIVSLSSIVTVQSYPGTAIYAASKAAVEQFSRILASELGSRGVTVNCVSPGAVNTDMLAASMPPPVQEMAKKQTPLGRLGEPADIADAVAFLCSDDGRWVTGQNIRTSGGA